MSEKLKHKIPTQRTRAAFKPDTFNEENRTIDVVFATESAVRMWDWEQGELVDEILVCSPEAGNLIRLNNGAPLLDNHRTYGRTDECVVGVVESARFENNQGVATVRFSKSEDDTRLMEKVKDGIVTGVSVGYNVSEYTIERREGVRDIYRATKWEATEISLTPVQADAGARVRSDEQTNEVEIIEQTADVYNSNENTPPSTEENTAQDPPEEIEEIINLNNEEMTEEEKKALEQKQRSEAALEERQRSSGIRKLVRALSGLDDSFADTLIDEGVTLEVAQTRALAEWEAKNPLTPRNNAQQQQTNAEQTRSAMSNALVLRINPQAAEIMGEENVRAASDFRGMNLLRLAEESLIRSGINTNGLTPREIAKGALGGSVRGLHHTTDFPLLLGDTINRTLLAQYMLQTRTFLAWCRRATMADFRAVTRVRLSEILGNLEEVKEGAEYKYGTMTESGETYKLAKYGKIIGVTWESIVNDDLSAFSRIPQSFAAQASTKQSDIVYSILTGNPVMSDGKGLFHADHGNYKGTAGNLTTGGTALSETSLAEAEVAFLNQKDASGQFINSSPRYLIVGPKNKIIAQKLTSTNFTPAKQGDIALPQFTGLTPIVDPRLTNYEWFLAADPNMIDTVEYAFLDGEQELFTDQREGFNIDGVEVKARMVFAAKAIDWRGLYRNNGAAPA